LKLKKVGLGRLVNVRFRILSMLKGSIMTPKLRVYLLSEEADKDLDSIFDYTEKAYGFNQAAKYLIDLESFFNHLIENPRLGRNRDEIKNNLLSISEQEHIVFYRIVDKAIYIVRVLHGSRDLSIFF
jgi:toxin ParE1/3/4